MKHHEEIHWKPNYEGYDHRTRLHNTVWGQLRYDWGRWHVMCRIKNCIRHPRCIIGIVSDTIPGWRYAGTIHRFEAISQALENGPIPQTWEEWSDFNGWFCRMVPQGRAIVRVDTLCAWESPSERVARYCGKDIKDMDDEELFRVASSMFGHYSDRMYPNAFNGAKLCIETVRFRQSERRYGNEEGSDEES